jgi:hypothetical protein
VKAANQKKRDDIARAQFEEKGRWACELDKDLEIAGHQQMVQNLPEPSLAVQIERLLH